MIYRFRIILDAEDDIFRDVELESSSTFEDLHNGTMKAIKMINGINHCEASHDFHNSASQIQTLLAQFHPY